MRAWKVDTSSRVFHFEGNVGRKGTRSTVPWILLGGQSGSRQSVEFSLEREKKEEKEMPKERPRIDEDYRPRVSIVIQRLPVARARGTALRGNLKRDGDTSSRDLKTIQSNPRKRYFRDNSISDLPILFPKKERKSHIYSPTDHPLNPRVIPFR